MKITNDITSDITLSFDLIKETTGIVVGDRDETESNVLKVYIPRLMLGINLESANCEAIEIDANIDIDLKNEENKNVGSNSITLTNYALIPPLKISGVSIPRFVKGELVRIVFADCDIKSPAYLPFQVANERLKRQTDIMRFSVPAKENIDDPETNDNQYYTEYNSRDQFLRIFTSNKNGEKCPFTMNWNTKDGIITMMDDSNRKFEWNYDEDKFEWTTDAGAVSTWKGADITHKCENYTIEASESIQMKTSKFKLKSDQGDFIIDNEYVENTSYEHKTTSAKQMFDMAELSGNLWQIISPGLFLDAPITIHTGACIFAGFYITKAAAPGKTPSVYSGGALDGASVGSSSSPSQQSPNTSSPSSKSAGSSSMTDFKGTSGQPVAYAKPTIQALQAIAKVADSALGLATFHGHPGEYKPLATGPFPSSPKPGYDKMMVATGAVSGISSLIPATILKA